MNIRKERMLEMKEEALDGNLLRSHFGRVYGPVVKLTTERTTYAKKDKTINGNSSTLLCCYFFLKYIDLSKILKYP
jgi:hypothetical protein